MILLQDITLSDENDCPYFEGRKCRFSYFFAHDLDGNEIELVLSAGWRKFGLYYFKPKCECRECVPMRVRVQDYMPSKEQRRVIRKNEDVKVAFSPLVFRDEIFDIYKEHSITRFGRAAEDRDTFIDSFFTLSCPSLMSEFYLDGNLAAVGFVDKTDRALSSVYFIYRNFVSKRSMGTFGMISEINHAAELGLEFYYPGYYIKDNTRMSYKGRFFPCEFMDMESGEWRVGTKDER